jgi:ring-1,2-phenylacetyl-CoA epoxidase subunit PaaE
VLTFHPLEVTAVDRIAEDAVCVRLAVPEALRGRFKHDAGQYVTLRRVIDGREERRTYSIVTPPGAAEICIGVREQAGGRMSRELGTRLSRGERLEVGTPTGRFRTAVDASRAQRYVAFAAGSGITPVLSLVSDILAREPASRVTLIYGNRSMSRTMFLEHTLALKSRHLDRFSVYFVMSREPQQAPLLNGRIDAVKVEALAAQLPDVARADEYFVCGPGDMVDAVRGAILRLNPGAPVRFERFAGPQQAGPRQAAAATSPQGTQPDAANAAQLPPEEVLAQISVELPPEEVLAQISVELPPEEVLAQISVVMDGRRRCFPMTRADASVLAAAERAGLDLPFSCRSGICATCRTRVKSGQAVMAHNIALERWEVDAGFILCCQARPLTASLELTYDEK